MGGGGFPIYYNIQIGGEGPTGTPNLYYVINGRSLVTTTQPLITAGETDGARKVKASQREVGEGVPEGEMQFLPLKSW